MNQVTVDHLWFLYSFIKIWLNLLRQDQLLPLYLKFWWFWRLFLKFQKHNNKLITAEVSIWLNISLMGAGLSEGPQSSRCFEQIWKDAATASVDVEAWEVGTHRAGSRLQDVQGGRGAARDPSAFCWGAETNNKEGTESERTRSGRRRDQIHQWIPVLTCLVQVQTELRSWSEQTHQSRPGRQAAWTASSRCCSHCLHPCLQVHKQTGVNTWQHTAVTNGTGMKKKILVMFNNNIHFPTVGKHTKFFYLASCIAWSNSFTHCTGLQQCQREAWKMNRCVVTGLGEVEVPFVTSQKAVCLSCDLTNLNVEQAKETRKQLLLC